VQVKLNCDLGESFGAWQMGSDDLIMPYIDMANIACGFHAGDPSVIKRTLSLACKHDVEIGAHPSYPDLQGFGRRSMKLSEQEIIDMLHYQIAALDGLAQIEGTSLSYVKPHGALYNDMMQHEHIFNAVATAVASYPKALKLMILGTSDNSVQQQIAASLNLTLLYEGFADRRYLPSGALTPRSQHGAVLSEQESLAQVVQLVTSKSVTSHCGRQIPLKLDTLCVHGDNPAAIELVKKIKQTCQS
jgi:UPF0271 protein